MTRRTHSREAGAACRKQLQRPKSNYSYYDYYQGPEQVARNRRTHLFEDVTGLSARLGALPQTFPLAVLGDYVDLDHCTGWQSQTGADFILVEPYVLPTPTDLCELADEGVLSIEIPVNISPYCGRWGVTPGALPWTRSYLFTTANNAIKLEEIARKLEWADTTCPPWNSL